MASHNRKSFECDICGWVFRERSNLKHHMEVHSGEIKKSCNVCGKLLSARYIPEHMKIHDGSKNHQCAICGHAFVTHQRLKRHMVCHTREMKYKCDLGTCTKAFLTSDKLLMHRRSHDEKMAFECSICQIGFYSIKSLRKHSNAHYLEGNSITSLKLKIE